MSSEQYGKLSWNEHISLIGRAIQMPFLVTFSIATRLFGRKRSLKHVITVGLFRYMTGHFTYRQIQNVIGTSLGVYRKWAKQNKVEPLIEQLHSGGRLLWIGSKRTDRVILYVHGGAFLLPIHDTSLDFWQYIQTELSKRRIDMGIAVLSYSIIPDGVFPIPLRQLFDAIEYLVNSGVQLQDLQIVGDSAGANLIIQFLSTMLNPLPSVPFSLPEDTHIRSVYLMSPWLSLAAGDFESFQTNSKSDIFSPATLSTWGNRVLTDVPSTDLPYVDVANAPEDWLQGLDRVVDRVLITTGSAECLRDADKLLFEKYMTNYHKDVRFVIQEGGIHNDPFFDFFLKSKKLGVLTPLILDWVAEGY